MVVLLAEPQGDTERCDRLADQPDHGATELQHRKSPGSIPGAHAAHAAHAEPQGDEPQAITAVE